MWNLSVNRGKTKVVEFKSPRSKQTVLNNYVFDGVLVDIVDSYTYLGIQFHSSGKCSFSAADICHKARKAIFKLKHDLPVTLTQDVSLSIKLFDSMVLPVLTYGCEIWGFESVKNGNCIDKLHLKFCREVLWVSQSMPPILLCLVSLGGIL